MDHKIQARLKWVTLYEKSGNAGVVCRRCGISRPTLRKWIRHYQLYGLEGLADHSRRPKSSPNQKIDDEKAGWILKLRFEHNIGARRIQNELKRQYQLSVSLSTIHKILTTHQVQPIRRPPRKKRIRGYSKKIPGERIQMDTCKIASGLYQYTAIDDCTRFQVLELYTCRTAQNTLYFLEKVIEEMPFPIQRIQTDRGREFFAYKVQEWLMEHSIKFRPIRPHSPHLNGKVERAQRTDLEEFYATANLQGPGLRDKLSEWQHFYNWERIHGSLGKPPIYRYFELKDNTPFWDDVIAKYDQSCEIFREQDYQLDLRLVELK